MIKTLGLVMGGLFLFGGILGFVPGVVRNGLYLGIFMVNTPHAVMHIASGVIFIVASVIGARVARWWFRVFGAIYAVLAIIGINAGDGLICGAISNNWNDAVGHAGLALAMLLVGFAPLKRLAIA